MARFEKNELDASMYLQEEGMPPTNYVTTTATTLPEVSFLQEYVANIPEKTFEDWLEDYPKLEAVYDFFKYTIWLNHIKEWLYEVKFFFQRLFTGYDDTDYWNIDLAVYKYALPLIKKYRRDLFNSHDSGETWSMPCINISDDPEEEYLYWLAIVNDIIWSLEESLYGTNEPILNCKECEERWSEMCIKNPDGSYTIKDCTNKKLHSKFYKEEKEYYKKVQKGLNYFHKYLHNLWT